MVIIYDKSKNDFLKDITSLKTNIEDIIEQLIFQKMKRKSNENEKRSWKNSLVEMGKVLNHNDIPGDARVAIEYNIPGSGKRIDFIVSGCNEDYKSIAIIIELKQRENVDITDKDGIVTTRVAKANREELHPSYQAISYVDLLYGYSEYVEEAPVNLKPCAFLHNYPHKDNKIDNIFYKAYLEEAPIFLKDDKEKLQNFIKKYVKYGDKHHIIYNIENGEIRPSKQLVDALVGMIQGNKEFTLIDEQKKVFENVKLLAKKAQNGKKKVIIVKGGPGTGKSVVAINLLVALNKEHIISQYVSKNASVRNVFIEKLTQKYKKTSIKNLFLSSGTFTESLPNDIGCLLVDEAHRLNEKSGIYSNLGENQVKEIINASCCSVFFIDEDQKVTLKDIGSIDEIKKWANFYKADIEELELSSQFRCGGSDGYLARLDYSLGIKETANNTLHGINYDFQVFDTPMELKNAIFEKNQKNKKSRIVAGYCWNWLQEGKNNSNIHDIVIDDFRMSRNLGNSQTYAIDDTSINEVGCVHTVQGLEFDYVGVIIGPDFLYRNGYIYTLPENRAKTDRSLYGYKKFITEKGLEGEIIVDKIIKNTYRVLMSRGMKGCYLYCTDKETREYFKKMIQE